MKGIIIYKSKYGSTRQYAKWLQESTGFDLFEVGKEPGNLSGYDTIILGCSIVIGSLTLKNWINTNWRSIQDKTIALMVTSAAGDIQTCEKAVTGSLFADTLDKIHTFALPGRYIVEKLTYFDGLLVKIAAKFIKDPVIKKGMVTSVDNMQRDHLREVEQFIIMSKL